MLYADISLLSKQASGLGLRDLINITRHRYLDGVVYRVVKFLRTRGFDTKTILRRGIVTIHATHSRQISMFDDEVLDPFSINISLDNMSLRWDIGTSEHREDVSRLSARSSSLKIIGTLP